MKKRVNINIDKQLHEKAKEHCKNNDVPSFSALIKDLLKKLLSS